MARKTTSKSSSPRKSPPRKAPRTASGSSTAQTAKGKGRDSSGGTPRRGRGTSGGRGTGYTAGSAKGKHLVIVESPAKARTINRYLGPEYVVLASVGHVRDLPSKAPKGSKAPVPGVDLEHDFRPTYEVLPGKDRIVTELKRAAKDSTSSGKQVWFATDLDREGEAIAWHLAQELGIDPEAARRVVFAAITRSEIEHAFNHPHPIDLDKVNAQQARRILDRIVGYQVSPLLWKKVARGLSAGRVQSVAVRLIVEREREIRTFVPDEYWQITGEFAPSRAEAERLAPQWQAFLDRKDDKGGAPTVKARNAWLEQNRALSAELVEVAGRKLTDIHNPGQRDDPRYARADDSDLTPTIAEIAKSAGLGDIRTSLSEDLRGVGPARWRRTISGTIDPATPYRITSIETRRTTSRPPPPFITSTLQQTASSRLGFAASRTMRAAQALYEGVEIPGEGPVGLITYMRTDSTHLANDALDAARNYIKRSFGDGYCPDKPNLYTSSNQAAQEAHEAIRPTSLDYPPSRVKNALTSDQLRLYQLIWDRFLACQMTPAQWDSTTVLIVGGRDPNTPCTFKATGRMLVFDGFYKVLGVPSADDQATLPRLEREQPLSPFGLDVTQKFTYPPPRYTEASLIKTLEAEGIGRPSTYASIIQVIQDRKYVELIERRFFATDLGEVVTDKLIEAFPRIMDVGYTREMEAELDKIEEDHLDWIRMLRRFYGDFSESLERAHDDMAHAKAEVFDAPDEYRCEQCGARTVYRFGKNGRFLSCSRYPECKYAAPVDREGRPRTAEIVNVRCPKTGRPMVRRTGRFGPFLATQLHEGEGPDVGMILNIDKKGHVTAPAVPPLETDLPCPKCESPLNLRSGIRGPWLGCSRFPRCRGRGKWTDLDEKKQAQLEAALEAHERAHPIPIIRTLDGRALTDAKGKPLPDAPTVEQLVAQAHPAQEVADAELEAVG